MFFKATVFLLSFLLIIGWRGLAAPLGLSWLGMLPLGALMLLPLIYFSWRSTLVFCLPLSLLWESATPLPFGSVAITLTVGCLLLQLLARHQLRANILTKIFAAVLLQSLVTLAIGVEFPPRTVAGVVLQMGQTIWQLALAGVLGLLWLWAMETLAKKRFEINLQQAVKEL